MFLHQGAQFNVKYSVKDARTKCFFDLCDQPIPSKLINQAVLCQTVTLCPSKTCKRSLLFFAKILSLNEIFYDFMIDKDKYQKATSLTLLLNLSALATALIPPYFK